MHSNRGKYYMNFYVYQYLSDNGTPYYIGKGSGRRMHVHHLFTPLPPVDRRIVIQDNLTNEEAKKLEVELITKYGRKLDGGILDNIKINQWACAVGWKHSDETKQKISEGNRGKTRTPEQKKNYKGTTSKEVAAKIAKTLTGRTRPVEVKEKIRQANLGKKLSTETISKRTESFKKTIEKRRINGYIPSVKKRESMLGEKNPKYGKKLSPETIAKRQAAYRITIDARRAAKQQENTNG